MKSLIKSPTAWSIALTIIIGQLAWPTTTIPTLLGPAFLLGLAPLLTLPIWQYCIAMLTSALIGVFLWGPWLGLAILLQFVLWYWAHKKQHTGWWVIGTLLPVALVFWQQSERNYISYLLTLGTVILQTLLYRGLTAVAKQKFVHLKEQNHARRGAERLLTAINQSQELEQLLSLGQALNETMEQTYGVYQDMELLARTNPKITPALVQDLLAAAQQIHQLRLQLLAWCDQQKQVLADLISPGAVSLHTLCRWITLLVADMAAKKGQQVQPLFDLDEDTWLTKDKQVSLGCLLLYICEQGLSKLTAETQHVGLRFSGYIAPKGLRLIITFAPAEGQEVSSEWPELQPLDLSDISSPAQHLNAICLTGVTSRGEHIYTLELG